jgi:hypothetical protein
MKTRLVLAVLLMMPFACAEELLEDGASKGNQFTQAYLVSQGAKNKALLLRVFDAVRKAEAKKNPGGARVLEVRQRISSTEFLVNAGGATDYWFIALKPKDLNNRDRLKTDAEFTGNTKSFRTESGETITVRVMKEVKSKPVPAFTKDEFVQRLKAGETWNLTDFEERKCQACNGKGMIGAPAELEECSDCEFGKITVDYIVKW